MATIGARLTAIMVTAIATIAIIYGDDDCSCDDGDDDLGH
jgi:hypothetical protein